MIWLILNWTKAYITVIKYVCFTGAKSIIIYLYIWKNIVITNKESVQQIPIVSQVVCMGQGMMLNHFSFFKDIMMWFLETSFSSRADMHEMDALLHGTWRGYFFTCCLYQDRPLKSTILNVSIVISGNSKLDNLHHGFVITANILTAPSNRSTHIYEKGWGKWKGVFLYWWWRESLPLYVLGRKDQFLSACHFKCWYFES